MNARRSMLSILAAGLLLLGMSACTATQVAVATGPNPPGFWLGLWHGFIAPVTFVVSLFHDTVRMYGVPNAGLWYDFGFMLGIGGFSGGVFAGSRKGEE